MKLNQMSGSVRPVRPIRPVRPRRQLVQPDPNDRFRYGATTVYTPARLKEIFDAANSGDTEQLCLCGREMLERNWDVIGALEQRSDALLGVDFDVQPGGPSEQDAAAAKAFEDELRAAGELNGLDTFYELISHLNSAVVMPFAASEIVWGTGGSLQGFSSIEAHHFTLRESFVPRLVCDEFPNGMPEEEAKHRFIFHQFRKKSDPARSGLIRVLAWLHCFQNWPLKDLFSFIERFGMPFVIAKVDQNAWENERQVLHSLIRNFGPNGGGVFTKATELQLLNASNTGGDNVYFRALEFTHNAIYTLLVGQLASSSDSSGMSNGDAQTAVRQDILEADARSLESTVRARIAAPWTAFHFNGAAVPKLHFKVEPADDQAHLAQVINTLSQAGFKADPAELSERFGMKLRYEAPEQPFSLTGPTGQTEDIAGQVQNLKQKYDALGVAIRAGLLTPTQEIEAQTRSELGLPEMPEEVKKAWRETGGIRRPLTIKTEDPAAPMSDLSDVSGRRASSVDRWFGPVARLLGELVDDPDPDHARKIMAKLDSLRSCGDFSDFVTEGEELTYDAIAAGAVAEHDRLKKRMRKREIRSGKQVDGQPAEPADQ